MFRQYVIRRIVAAALVASTAVSANAQTAPAAAQAPGWPGPPPASDPKFPEPKLLNPPLRIPAPGGEVVLTFDTDKQQYDDVHFAFVRRAGDFLYLSGRVAGIRPGYPYDVESYKASVRRLFKRLGDQLHAAGADFKDIVMIHSFHVFRNGNEGIENKRVQFEAFSAVKDEFMPPPYPAWTAVGVDTILVDAALTEADFVAYAPQKRAR